VSAGYRHAPLDPEQSISQLRSGELTAVKTQKHATTNHRCSPAASVKRPASAPAKRGKRAFLAEDGTFDRRIIMRHRTKNIAVASIGDPSRHLCAIGCQCFRLSTCAIVDGDTMVRAVPSTSETR
jgi:hypothetical protein